MTIDLLIDLLFVIDTFHQAVMFVGGLWCHQLPERSPQLWNLQLPLCWRCCGIILGTWLLLLWLVKVKQLCPRTLSFVLALLMPFDVLLGSVLNLWQAGATMRFATGILWGLFGTSTALHLLLIMTAALRRFNSHSNLQTTAYAPVDI